MKPNKKKGVFFSPLFATEVWITKLDLCDHLISLGFSIEDGGGGGEFLLTIRDEVKKKGYSCQFFMFLVRARCHLVGGDLRAKRCFAKLIVFIICFGQNGWFDKIAPMRRRRLRATATLNTKIWLYNFWGLCEVFRTRQIIVIIV